MNYHKYFNIVFFTMLTFGVALNCMADASSDEPFRSVVCPSSDENLRNSEADIIELKDGRLLLAWSKFIGRKDHDAAVIAAKFSKDKGRSWGEEFIIQENIGARNVMSVSFIRLQSGKILFFFFQKNSFTNLNLFVRESVDEAKTWSKPLRVTKGKGYHIMNNDRVIQLKDGRILAPISYCLDISKNMKELVGFCYISDDEGKTWFKGSGKISFKNSGVMEPGLVQRPNGSLLMNIRTSLGLLYKSFSYDRGNNWTKAIPTKLISPDGPSSTIMVPDSSDILIVWNNNPLGKKASWGERTPLTSAISSDDGKSWKNIKNLEGDPNSGFAYTSITLSGDRVLLTYYHWRKGNPNFALTDLIFRSLPLKWFYEK